MYFEHAYLIFKTQIHILKYKFTLNPVGLGPIHLRIQRPRGKLVYNKNILQKINTTNKKEKRIKTLTTTVFGGLYYQTDIHLLRGWIDEPTTTLTTNTGGYRRLPTVTEKCTARTHNTHIGAECPIPGFVDVHGDALPRLLIRWGGRRVFHSDRRAWMEGEAGRVGASEPSFFAVRRGFTETFGLSVLHVMVFPGAADREGIIIIILVRLNVH